MLTDIDEILASWEYIDRQGRVWGPAVRHGWALLDCRGYPIPGLRIADDSQMRLLIERDQHRDDCRGVRDCQDHPEPRVFKFVGPFGCWSALGPGRYAVNDSAHPTLPAAMDAARALAVAI